MMVCYTEHVSQVTYNCEMLFADIAQSSTECVSTIAYALKQHGHEQLEILAIELCSCRACTAHAALLLCTGIELWVGYQCID